jgi:cyclic beta-1,2-glucan synthetase
MNPCIPAMWPKYSLAWTFGRTHYRITVLNPDHRCTDVKSAEMNGHPVDASAIPLADDGGTHDVVIVLGERNTTPHYG